MVGAYTGNYFEDFYHVSTQKSVF